MWKTPKMCGKLANSRRINDFRLAESFGALLASDQVPRNIGDGESS